MIIFLVGFMGCGKSTIGRRIARRLGYGFVDTDSVVEDKAGKRITDIFAGSGEDEFRRLETEAIEELPEGEDIVVATGGGLPCFGDNLGLMKSKGLLVYFKMRHEMLFGRLKGGRERRPKLAGVDDARHMEYVRETLAQREPYYAQASMVIDCNGVSDEYIASHISRLIEASGHE